MTTAELPQLPARIAEDNLEDHVQKILKGAGIAWSISKVMRHCNIWRNLADPNGHSLYDYFVNRLKIAAQSSRSEREAIAALRALLDYHDPTGIKATVRADRRRRVETPELLKKTPHCYRAGRNTPQGVRHVGGVGSGVVHGLMDDDSECDFCTCTGGNHSRSCPRRSR